MPDLPRVGEEFGNYRLGQRLGRGGMSVVYQAENWRLGNVVALKILAPDLAHDDNFRTRFLRESRIAAGFNHPHVVPIIDSGAYDGLLYIAMRYVAGTDLRQMIAEQRRLDPGTAVHLLSQAALALDAAHRRGLVHRDVKPANLLVERTSDDADPDHLYLADFGITKYVGEPGMFGGLTTAGTILGTALYLAPEQALELAVGGAADQYALGCVLYECLTGRAPFEKGSGQATMIAHVEEPPPPATTFRPDLPPAVDAVFDRVLAKHPGQRYPTCRAFMAAASDALRMAGALPGGLPGAPPSGTTPAFRPAPLPPAGLPDAVGSPADRQYLATQDLAGGADRDGGDAGRPPRKRQVRGYRQARTRLIVIALAILAAVGTGGWMLMAQPFKAKAPATYPSTPAAATRPASGLFSVLEQTEKFVPSGDLHLSGCTQVSETDVECANPAASIADVSFVTYPTLSALYLHYREIIAGLTGKEPFAAVQNKGACDATAPEPTGEGTWNHSDGLPAPYTASQMATGTVPTDIAMGRVFCVQLSNGSEKIVWTADSGDFLGYATGTASHEQVYQWWYYVHHQIIFPGDTGMSRTMPMPASASPGSSAPLSAPARRQVPGDRGSGHQFRAWRSARAGGSAPGRAQVRAATAAAARSAAPTSSRSRRSGRPRSCASHQARKPPPNASPAPMVSATWTTGTGSASTAPGRNARAGRGPSVTRTSDGPTASSAAAASPGGRPGYR
jgi:Protein kinase domain